MRKVVYGLIAVIMVFGLVGCATMGTEPSGAQQQALSAPTPIVVVASPMVKMDKKATVSIVGSGFTPGQELALLITDANGVHSDIGDALKPEPKANESGAWYTTWSCGRFISKKLVKEGAYAITVTDTDYNPLAHAPVAFYKAKEKKKK
jgi:hypothetical protein